MPKVYLLKGKEFKALTQMIHLTNNSPTKILWLGYGYTQTRIIKSLIAHNCVVEHANGPVLPGQRYHYAICFGYKHILTQDMIDRLGCPILNLHISYLPYNRGAHPNFWSFYDNTPSGVTIHLIDSGVDTGPIVRQKYVSFDESADTFAKTYSVLIENIENLFLEFLPSLLAGTWTARQQKGKGTYHSVTDLPLNFAGWDSNIKDELARLDIEGLRYEK